MNRLHTSRSLKERTVYRQLPGVRGRCWEWNRGKATRGYGQVYHAGKAWATHRLMWTLEAGRSIPRGRFVCHSCDNPPCINPKHLWLGTPLQNSRDMVRKKRSRTSPLVGPQHARYGKKLTPKQRRELKTAQNAARQARIDAGFEWTGKKWKKKR